MSKPQSARTRPEVIESIENQSEGVRKAAVELTNRIELFETYLSALKGRVETLHFGRHPDSDGVHDVLELALRLHRKQKDWMLSWSDYHPNHHEVYGMEWQPLKEAPLKIKIAAVKMFPDFLESIEKSQVRLREEIETATRAFDDFSKALSARKERA